MRIIFTKHCMVRMKERGVSKDEVLEVIRDPSFTKEVGVGRVKSRKMVEDRMVHVISKRTAGAVIITCY